MRDRRTPRPVERRRVDLEARAERRAERRAALLDAALTAVRRDGPGVSMDAIAAQAGITKPILYKHFGDRDGLVAALADQFADQLTTELGAALADTEIGDRELLRRTLDTFLGFIERDPQLYAFLVGSALSTTTGEQIAGLIPRISKLVAMVIGERLRAVGADSAVAEPWAYALVGMGHFAGHWWLDRGTLPRQFMVDALTQLAWSGMSSAEPSERTDN